ncbi:hypothetical protein M501DRAFT_1009862 [Patellaria atrata CBS 101060]|uniref:DUF7918 domain-containing protein n=1 Tax=Patellaria atrata CBS 101060 TaxID=1346257 RepID=A0A9P4SEZ2_9PEZI|nr:hypothetical protein M501DRAFT_1009862 [Patellaria atrata CBS 101060]
MAVIKGIPGLEISVVVDNDVVEEYDDEEAVRARKSVTKYIEAKSGAYFAVKVNMTNKLQISKKYAVIVNIRMDGQSVKSTFFKAAEYKNANGNSTLLNGVTVHEGSQCVFKKFCFSDVAIGDGDVRHLSGEKKKTIDNLGQISVEVWRGRLGEPKGSSARQFSLKDVGTIPEKALKGRALSHKAGLGPGVPAEPGTSFNMDYIDKDSPFAAFNFKYRSLQALRSLCIVPRSPTPVALEDRPIEELNPEELRELLRRERELNAVAGRVKMEGIKREREETQEQNGEEDEITVLEERPRKAPRTSASNTEIIDLCSDDE